MSESLFALIRNRYTISPEYARFMGEEYEDVGIPFSLKSPPDPESGWITGPRASEIAIERLVQQSKLSLPTEYLDFLRLSNGGGGGLDVNPWRFELWSAEEVLEHNEGYDLEEYTPGYFGFGSSGGGECFVFDVRQPQPWKVYIIPFIPLDEEYAELVSNSFSELLDHVVPSGDGSDQMETLGEELRNN